MRGFAIYVLAVVAAAASAASTSAASAASTSAAAAGPDAGRAVYERWCAPCHGLKGGGDGPAAGRLLPPPRDFTFGQYKFKTTPFDEPLAADEDLLRTIRDGLASTSMPGWKGFLPDDEIAAVAAHVKTLSGIKQAPTRRIDLKAPFGAAADLQRGAKLFSDRCSECHGEEARGDGTKRLKDDLGARTWPMDLTKPWAYKAGPSAPDVYARITAGIPGTQMPSFADPKSRKYMTDEERRDVASFVESLSEKEAGARPVNPVIRSARVTGGAPTDPLDEKWRLAEPAAFGLFPQLMTGERHFTPANDSMTVRALHDPAAGELSILLEWHDRTESLPGSDKAREIAGGEPFEDAVAVQWPVSSSRDGERPYFGMGQAGAPVNIWHWSSGGADRPAGVRLLNGTGPGRTVERNAARAGLAAKGVYSKGVWRVAFRRALAPAERGADLEFAEGVFIPVAFAAWDGSNNERGPMHTMTGWRWIFLEPERGSAIYAVPVAVAGVVFGLMLYAAMRGGRRR